MYVRLTRKDFVAGNWRFAFCMIVLLVPVAVLVGVWDALVSVVMTVVMRRYQPYAQWDADTFLEWKYPWELLIVAPTALLMAITIFVLVPFEISLEPHLRPGPGYSEQRTALDGDNSKTAAAAQNAIDNGSINSIIPVEDPEDSEPEDGTAAAQITVDNAESVPGIRQFGRLPQLPKVVLPESPWSTETESDLLAVTGHDWKSGIRSNRRWASSAVKGPAEALNAYSSHSQAVVPATSERSQGSTALSSGNQTLSGHSGHGRNLFPVRHPRRQKAGRSLHQASKARSIHDQALDTYPSSEQNPMALQIFNRAPSSQASSNSALTTYESYDQTPDPSPTSNEALTQRSIYHQAPDTPLNSNLDSVALQTPTQDLSIESGSVYSPTAFRGFGQALITLPVSHYVDLAFRTHRRVTGFPHIDPRWDLERYNDLPPGTPSPRPRRRRDGIPHFLERDWIQASVAPWSHDPAPATPPNLNQACTDVQSPDLTPTSRANPGRTMGAANDNLHWAPGTPSPQLRRRPGLTGRFTSSSGSGRSLSRSSNTIPPKWKESSFEDQLASRRAYKQNLFEEAKTWKGHSSEARLKSLIMLDDKNDDQPRRLISRERIDRDWENYEYYARERQNRDPNHPFSVYGRPEFHDLDVLKLWVNSNQHIYDTWPPGYTPQKANLNKRDDASSIFSAETSSDLDD